MKDSDGNILSEANSADEMWATDVNGTYYLSDLLDGTQKLMQFNHDPMQESSSETMIECYSHNKNLADSEQTYSRDWV